MPTALITGAGRGLGAEFVRQYAGAGWNVIATVRDAAAGAALNALGNVRVETLDMRDAAAVARFGERLGDVRIDVAILNAGISGPNLLAGAQDAAGWLEVFAVNTVAPTQLAYGLLPRMAPGGKLVAITSQMGSIADNGSGGYGAYRASKAALNAAWKSLAIEQADRDLAIALLHPGWVQTDMGGAGAPIEPPASIAGMRRVIDGLTRADKAVFLTYEGKTLPW